MILGKHSGGKGGRKGTQKGTQEGKKRQEIGIGIGMGIRNRNRNRNRNKISAVAAQCHGRRRPQWSRGIRWGTWMSGRV